MSATAGSLKLTIQLLRHPKGGQNLANSRSIEVTAAANPYLRGSSLERVNHKFAYLFTVGYNVSPPLMYSAANTLPLHVYT